MARSGCLIKLRRDLAGVVLVTGALSEPCVVHGG